MHRRRYSEIYIEDGPLAVLNEFFERESYRGFWPKDDRRGFMHTSAFSIERSVNGETIHIGYGSFKYVRESELKGRSFIVTLWDYRPGITFMDCVHEPRQYRSRPFENDEEKRLIEAHCMAEAARIQRSIISPFEGVL